MSLVIDKAKRQNMKNILFLKLTEPLFYSLKWHFNCQEKAPDKNQRQT